MAQGVLAKAGSNPELKMLMTCKSQGFESPFGGRDSTRAGACVHTRGYNINMSWGGKLMLGCMLLAAYVHDVVASMFIHTSLPPLHFP